MGNEQNYCTFHVYLVKEKFIDCEEESFKINYKLLEKLNFKFLLSLDCIEYIKRISSNIILLVFNQSFMLIYVYKANPIIFFSSYFPLLYDNVINTNEKCSIFKDSSLKIIDINNPEDLPKQKCVSISADIKKILLNDITEPGKISCRVLILVKLTDLNSQIVISDLKEMIEKNQITRIKLIHEIDFISFSPFLISKEYFLVYTLKGDIQIYKTDDQLQIKLVRSFHGMFPDYIIWISYSSLLLFSQDQPFQMINFI